MVSNTWSENIPIYKQLEALIVSWILNNAIQEGEALPSVRKLSVEYSINHLTVAKAFDNLVSSGVVEKRRGLGMFVSEGAKAALNSIEKTKFYEDELPAFAKRVKDLDLDQQELIKKLTSALEAPSD